MTDENKHMVDGVEPKYYSRIPNMVVDDLPYAELALYTYYKRIASDKGKCWQSTSTIAKSLKMSPGKLRTTRGSLKERGLISIEIREKGGQECDTKVIVTVNVWQQNIDRYTLPPTETCLPPNTKQATPLPKRAYKENLIRKPIEEKKDLPPENGGSAHLIYEEAIIATLMSIAEMEADGEYTYTFNGDVLKEMAERGLIPKYAFADDDIALTDKGRQLLAQHGGSGTGDDGAGEWVELLWLTRGVSLFCHKCDGQIGYDGTYYKKGSRTLCPGCYVARNDTNPPTPPTPHERYQALEARKNAPQLTAEQAVALHTLDTGALGNIGMGIREQLFDGGFVCWQPTDKGFDKLSPTDTGRAALEDYQCFKATCLRCDGKCPIDDVDDFTTCPKCKTKFDVQRNCSMADHGEDCDKCEFKDGCELIDGVVLFEQRCDSKQSKDCAGTEHINPAVLCEVVEEPAWLEHCVLVLSSLKEIDKGCRIPHEQRLRDVCPGCPQYATNMDVTAGNWQTIDWQKHEAPKPAPKKGRAKATCSKCGKKARKVVEDGMCWECNGYPDRAAMIDIIYARLGWPNTNTMYKSNNTKVVTTLTQWGATLKNLDRYVDEMIVVSQSQNWTLTINALSNESRFLTWITEDKATNYIDAPLFAESKPRPESPPVIMTPDELAELEERVRKQMTELPTLPPEEGSDE